MIGSNHYPIFHKMRLNVCSLFQFFIFNLLSHYSLSVNNLRFLQLDRSHTLISPSVAKADLCNLLESCSAVVNGGADMLHFSVQDGRFVPKISFGHDFIKALRPHFQNTVFDVKLGVIEPEHRIKDFVKSGADIISIHPEASYQPLNVIQMISDAGIVPGIVLLPSTSLESILYMIDHVQIVVIMLGSPGWGGKPYIPTTIEKIKKLVKV
jgi:ribulose-phosphate 3-epimerase